MQDIKNKIEAVLFMTGRLMKIDEIAEYCGIKSVGVVKQAMKALHLDYQKKESGLEVYKEEDSYKLNIKKEYNHLSTKLVSGSELDPPSQATLALIAYKQPAIQSEIIKMRGNTAYDHIKALKEQDFVLSEKFGRTRMLKLTTKFFDYFDIVEQETLKKKFKNIADKQEEKLANDIKENAKEDILEKLSKDEKIEIVNKKEEKVEAIVELSDENKEEIKSTTDLENLDPEDFGS
ncbi:MAG: SMC-Scp complex subunit ScpB [Nanoarchaeota archaeon]|nr:SMC-Scp complex subunit ScpB [Nanoarchaeota archaeon]